MGIIPLCRKLRRRYCLVISLVFGTVVTVLRHESPIVESEIEQVEHSLAAEVGLTGVVAPAVAAVAAQPPTAVSGAPPMMPPSTPPTPPPPSSSSSSPPPPPPPPPPTQVSTQVQQQSVADVRSSVSQTRLAPPFSVPADAEARRRQQNEWKQLGNAKTDQIDVEAILAQLSYKNPWNPSPRGSKGIGSWTQGWDVAYDKQEFQAGEPLQVFVMPHSHNDPGWLWSFEGYYEKYTGGIITTVVKALKANRQRRFIWAEVSFFEMWWGRQDEAMRQNARDVVASGQLEFVTGGWVMNDEANCHIYAILEQLYEGREWVEDTFGVSPTTGYAVDPFGQSAVMAQVLKRMGYQAMYINRVQYAIKRVLAEQHNLGFIWRQHWDPEGTTDIPVHMHPFFNYDVPHSCGPQPGVCCQFDFLRLETPGMTCPWGVKPQPINDRNVRERSQTYLDQIKKKATLFGGRSGTSKVVLVPIGGDLEYQHDSIAAKMFENYEAMFKHINSDPSYNTRIQFGTLQDYFTAMREEHLKQSNLRVLSGPSFFTYADKDEEYWSGYYTSRPFYKQVDRNLEALLHAAEFLYSVIRPSINAATLVNTKIKAAKRAMALFQHHDAITGTSKHSTMDDYGQKLYQGVTTMQCLLAALLLQMTHSAGVPLLNGLKFAETRPGFQQLPTRGVLSFPTEGSARVVVLFNPLGRSRTTHLLQAVDSANVCVRNADGSLRPAQINPLFSSDLTSRQSGYELVSPIEVPAFAVKIVELVRDAACDITMAAVWQSSGSNDAEFPTQEGGSSVVLENEHVSATFSNGLLDTVRPSAGRDSNVKESFAKYHTTKSGAYIFVPNGEAAPVAVDTVRHITGPFVSIVHAIVQGHVARSARLGQGDLGLSMDHYVDITAQSNEEWIVRYDTDYVTGRTLYTELNGWTTDRHIIRDDDDVPLQTKYFPMPAGAFLEDGNTQRRMSLQAAQACGVGSMSEGSVEIMLDRRLTKDDGRGMNEAMNDNLANLNSLVLIVEDGATRVEPGDSSRGNPSLASLLVAEQLNRPLVQMILDDTVPLTATTPREVMTLQALDAKPWPCELHLDALKVGRHGPDNVRARLARRSFDARFGALKGCDTTLEGNWVDSSTLFGATPAASAGVVPLTLGGKIDDSFESPMRGVYLPKMEWATVEWSWPPSSRPGGTAQPINYDMCGGEHTGTGAAAAADERLAPGDIRDDNTDWGPPSSDSREAQSTEECCNLCRATPGCKAGVFNPSGSRCWIKYDISQGRVSAPGEMSCRPGSLTGS